MSRRFSYRSLLLQGFEDVKLLMLLAAALFLMIDIFNPDFEVLALIPLLALALKQVRGGVLSYTFASIVCAMASVYFLKLLFTASVAALGDIHITTAILTNSGLRQALALFVLGFGGIYAGFRLLFLPMAILDKKSVMQAFSTVWNMTRDRALELYFFYVLCSIPFLALAELNYYMGAILPFDWIILICFGTASYIVAAVAIAFCGLYVALERASEAKPRS